MKNLAVTVLMQDPLDPGKLTPIATLLPDREPAEGFNLGPLQPKRGPFIFSNDQVFPNLIDALMQNPRGLVYRVANFDIIDEIGRNFAFTSQEINDRTASLLIDNGSFDSDSDGEGDLTEYHRVATGTGREVEIDGQRRRIIFDAQGNQVGISLREALESALGLTHYDEAATPTRGLTAEQIESSYSTVLDPDSQIERIWRIRNTARGASLQDQNLRKAWEILTPTGIGEPRALEDIVLSTESDLKLAFVEDDDDDRVTKALELMNNCLDSRPDSDGDGLLDREEILLGFEIDINGRSRKVFSSCSLTDSDRDGLTDFEEVNISDDDDDNDGVSDAEDRFPFDPFEWADNDGDGIGNNADTDDDNDGFADDDDFCPLNFTFPGSNVDDDGDGFGNDCDAFIEDSAEWLDTDTDFIGNNADTDDDGDNIPDDQDAFPLDFTEHADSDGDGVGDFADAFPADAGETKDSDGDGVGDNIDAFPFDPNETADTDNDGVGNNNPNETDDDNDTVPDATDNCPLVVNKDQADADGDGVGNLCDAFPFDSSETTNSDGDGTGDNADLDDDNDGVNDEDDLFPLDPNESADSDGDGVGDNRDAFPNNPAETLDSDNDGIGNNEDEEDDGDNIADEVDAFPLDPNEANDDDGDGVGDDSDAFPFDPAETLDSDGDGVGNNADPDDDNDGIPDADDFSPVSVDKVRGRAGRFRTDPFSQDTDGDGLTDKEEIDGFEVTLRATGEVKKVFTDPTRSDTDGDGAADNIEARLGGDPQQPQ